MTAAPEIHSKPPLLGRAQDVKRSFALMLMGEGIGYAGSAVHAIALPALAVLYLHAGPEQVALLACAAKLPLWWSAARGRDSGPPPAAHHSDLDGPDRGCPGERDPLPRRRRLAVDAAPLRRRPGPGHRIYSALGRVARGHPQACRPGTAAPGPRPPHCCDHHRRHYRRRLGHPPRGHGRRSPGLHRRRPVVHRLRVVRGPDPHPARPRPSSARAAARRSARSARASPTARAIGCCVRCSWPWPSRA